MTLVARIQAALEAVCPIQGFQLDEATQIIVPDYAATATAPQRAAARAVAQAFDWSPQAQATWAVGYHRAQALGLLTVAEAYPVRLLRAVVVLVKDELNLHALKMNAILDAVDGAGSLAALKTAVAAIPDYPPRTNAQLVTALTNALQSGQVD